MSAFQQYAEYYDLLYREKDYKKEAAYIESKIKKHFRGNVKSILELGCGTGEHAFYFGEKGYEIHGIDISEKMLEIARKKLKTKKLSNVTFSQADIRGARLDRTFDVVISLFHVMSYQIANEDLFNAFLTASRHLKPGGLFLFDCWYGPGVLSDPPLTRVKRIANESVQITRISEPTPLHGENAVIVDYELLVKDKRDHTFRTIRERHKMRYLFQPEVLMFFQSAGFEWLETSTFLKDAAPSGNDWNVLFIGRRKEQI